MACCIAIAFLIAVTRTAWRWTLRKPEPEPEFPPPAWRPGPAGEGGSTTPAPEPAPDRAAAPGRTPALAPEAARAARPLAASGLLFAAVGASVYALAVAVLLYLGAADQGAEPAVGWWTRHGVVVALAAAALAGEHLLRGGESRLEGRARLSSALIGAGGAWLALGVLDQHVFELFAIADGSLAWDVVFHGVGSLAVVAGWALLPTSPALRPASASP